jgi:hypothetical protein
MTLAVASLLTRRSFAGMSNGNVVAAHATRLRRSAAACSKWWRLVKSDP